MHFAFHHANVAGCDAHNFLITSHDTDVVIVGVLAQACGHIGPNTAGPESLQVRQSTKGGGNFVDVNRVYQAICSNVPWKQDEQHIPDWFVSDEAKAILFVLVYFLAGCDFLPAFYNMPFPRMFSLVVETVCTPGLFDEAVVESKLDATGRKRWCVDTEQCVKMLAVCYFMLHWDCFSTHYPDGAAAMFKECNDVPTFVDKVRGIIFDAKGFNGKKQCPGFDALMFQSQRGDAVMEYWESSCAEKPWEVWFEARGWAKERPEEPFGRDNVVTVLSQHAILRRGGRVKVLLCTCDPQKSGVLVRKCKTCGCGQRNVACVPGYCKCQLKCRDGARVDTASAPPMTHGVNEPSEETEQTGREQEETRTDSLDSQWEELGEAGCVLRENALRALREYLGGSDAEYDSAEDEQEYSGSSSSESDASSDFDGIDDDLYDDEEDFD